MAVILVERRGMKFDDVEALREVIGGLGHATESPASSGPPLDTTTWNILLHWMSDEVGHDLAAVLVSTTVGWALRRYRRRRREDRPQKVILYGPDRKPLITEDVGYEEHDED